MTLRLLPPPCELPGDGPDIDCLVCLDTGEFVPDNSSIRMPCPDCRRGDYSFWAELNDDGRRDR